MVGGLFKRPKSISELEEETEQKDAENRLADKELSLAQKRELIARLKERGLQPKHFSFNWTAIKKFLSQKL